MAVTVGGAYIGAAEQSFRLASSSGDEVRLRLQPGEEWEETVQFTLTEPGLHQVSWDLYAEGAGVPERSVHLWIRVT